MGTVREIFKYNGALYKYYITAPANQTHLIGKVYQIYGKSKPSWYSSSDIYIYVYGTMIY